MKSGKLDRRIIIQQATHSRDAVGADIETWDTWSQLPDGLSAGLEPQSVTERFGSDQRFATCEMVMRIRWYPIIETLMNPKDFRVVYRDRVYALLGMQEIGRREGAWLLLTARTDRGGGTA